MRGAGEGGRLKLDGDFVRITRTRELTLGFAAISVLKGANGGKQKARQGEKSVELMFLCIAILCSYTGKELDEEIN